jgi:hypothetical protein
MDSRNNGNTNAVKLSVIDEETLSASAQDGSSDDDFSLSDSSQSDSDGDFVLLDALEAEGECKRDHSPASLSSSAASFTRPVSSVSTVIDPASSQAGSESLAEGIEIEITIDPMVTPKAASSGVSVAESSGFGSTLPQDLLRQRGSADSASNRRSPQLEGDQKASASSTENQRSNLWCICDCFKGLCFF